VVVVDLDPEALESCRRQGLEVIYGDAEDPEFVLSLPFDQARWVVSTVPGLDINLALLHGLRAAGYREKVAVTAHTPLEASRLREEDVDVVIAPFAVAADHLVSTLMSSGAAAEPAVGDGAG
jgi:Trk K+ transport system NAD-binding subunit